MTRIALFLGLFTPKRWMEQTNSQILHPEHRSATTANFQDMFSSLHNRHAAEKCPSVPRFAGLRSFLVIAEYIKYTSFLEISGAPAERDFATLNLQDSGHF